jgi:hypothetical protein
MSCLMGKAGAGGRARGMWSHQKKNKVSVPLMWAESLSICLFCLDEVIKSLPLGPHTLKRGDVSRVAL